MGYILGERRDVTVVVHMHVLSENLVESNNDTRFRLSKTLGVAASINGY